MSDLHLQQRLETLEQDNRRLRRLNMITLGGMAVLLGLAVALTFVAGRYGMPGMTADVVSARQFVLRAADGTVRGQWGLDEKGALRLVMQDPNGAARVKLNLLEDGAAGLSFADSAGHARAVFAVLPDQTVSLVLADESGRTRSVLGLSSDGSATMVFADKGGNTRAGLGVDARGLGTFTLYERGVPQFDQAEPDSASDSPAPADSQATGATSPATQSTRRPRPSR